MKSKKIKDGKQSSSTRFCYATLNAILVDSVGKSNLAGQSKHIKVISAAFTRQRCRDFSKRSYFLSSRAAVILSGLSCCLTHKINQPTGIVLVLDGSLVFESDS